jgi:hypothetical protein
MAGAEEARRCASLYRVERQLRLTLALPIRPTVRASRELTREISRGAICGAAGLLSRNLMASADTPLLRLWLLTAGWSPSHAA